MRTIRRISLKLNSGKFDALQEVASAYAREKQEHLPVYHDDALFAAHAGERVRRDELVREGYISPHGVSGRMWKLAQKDAYETVNKEWAALAEEIRPLIGAHKANKEGNAPCGTVWTEAQLRYAYWLVYTPRRMAGLVLGRAVAPKHFNIGAGERKVVCNYLRRIIRRKRGNRPEVRLERSFALDANMYDVEQAGERQVIAVTGLVPRKRIRIPLTGNTVITGNIRVVLDREKQRVEVHYSAGMEVPDTQEGEVAAVDAGLSEVFTDEEGTRYGTGLGRLIGDESDRILKRNQRRNKLYQVAKKHERKGNRRKARRICKFNLGKKKQNKNKRRNRAEMERQINTALNSLMKTRQPSILVTEKLDIRGKAKSRGMSRRVSLWPRGVLQERTEFVASAAGCRREQVNPAYSSQLCPRCGFVNGQNRQGDRFQCLNCGHIDDADRVAAQNLKSRRTDPEITLWTPKEKVRAILTARFTERSADLEAPAPFDGNGGTVAGRTPVAASAIPDGTLSTERETTDAIPAGQNVGDECLCLHTF